MRALVTLFVAGLIFAVAQGAAAENEADCSELSLKFDAGGDWPYCYAGKMKGRNGGGRSLGWAADWEYMAADSDAATRGAEVVIGNRWSYVEVQTVKAALEEKNWFGVMSDWGEPYKIDGDEVARFEATWEGIEYPWHCAGFTRYSVRSGPGYREALRGWFCVASYVELEEETLRGFLGSISY